MSPKRDREQPRDPERGPCGPGGPGRPDASSSENGDSGVRAGGWTDRRPAPRRAAFPAGGQVDEPLRVWFSRGAYADLVAHAKENLDAEVCGVLVGEFCDDEHGLYVAVQAALRGTSAQHGTSHVTYTQETWNRIHERLESDYRGQQIVGWYHSHPGFGVEFSDMDLFIQNNFFAGTGQIAFVTDPLGGDEAVCAKAEDGLRHIEHFWVEDRQRQCHRPAASGAGEGAAETAEALRVVEERLGQTLQAVEDLRNALYRFLVYGGMFIGLGVVFAIGYTLYNQYLGAMKPPELQNIVHAFLPTPVKIGEDWRYVGVILTTSKLGAEEQALLKEMERRSVLAEEAERQKSAAPPAAGGASPAPSAAPPRQPAGQGAPSPSTAAPTPGAEKPAPTARDAPTPPAPAPPVEKSGP